MLTPFQTQCLAFIENELKAEPAYAAWMKPSYLMALIQEESGWNKDILSADGLGSIGLMQPLPATAREAATEAGITGSMHDPSANIRVGMWCFHQKHRFLAARLPRPLQLDDVVAAYNEGEGNVLKGRADQSYVDRFHRYQAVFAFVDQVMDNHPVQAAPLEGDIAPVPAPEPAVEPVEEPAAMPVEEPAAVPVPAPSVPAKKAGKAPDLQVQPAGENSGGQDQDSSADALNAAELVKGEQDAAVDAAEAVRKAM
jgi:hypothetical protein